VLVTFPDVPEAITFGENEVQSERFCTEQQAEHSVNTCSPAAYASEMRECQGMYEFELLGWMESTTVAIFPRRAHSNCFTGAAEAA
jgi:hypothetical protein